MVSQRAAQLPLLLGDCLRSAQRRLAARSGVRWGMTVAMGVGGRRMIATAVRTGAYRGQRVASASASLR